MRARSSSGGRLRAAGIVIIGLLSAAFSAGAEDLPLAVIVHPNRTEAIDRAELRRIYLRVRRQWDDGAPIAPVNREAGSSAREAFAKVVLGMSPTRLAAYWNERYFDGVLPPITLSPTLSGTCRGE